MKETDIVIFFVKFTVLVEPLSSQATGYKNEGYSFYLLNLLKGSKRTTNFTKIAKITKIAISIRFIAK